MKDYEYGCTDGNCILHRPTGMHTNGGCDCLKSLPPRLRRKFGFHIRRLRRERDEARAEADARVLEQMACRDAIRAEVERLREERDEAVDGMKRIALNRADHGMAEAEVERLLEDLRTIAQVADRPCVVEIARAALAEGEGGDDE